MFFLNQDSLTFFFPWSVCLLFPFRALLHLLGPPVQRRVKVIRANSLALFLIIREKQSVTIKYDSNCGFFIDTLSCWGSFPLFLVYWKLFYHEWVWNCIKCFLAAIEMITWFSFFYCCFVNMVIYTDWFSAVEANCLLFWSWCVIFLHIARYDLLNCKKKILPHSL